MQNCLVIDIKRDTLLYKVNKSYLSEKSKIDLKKTIHALHNLTNSGLCPPLSSYLCYIIKSNSYHEANNVIKLIEDITFTYSINEKIESIDIVELINPVKELSIDINEPSLDYFVLESRNGQKHKFTKSLQTTVIKRQSNLFFANIYMSIFTSSNVNLFLENHFLNFDKGKNILVLAMYSEDKNNDLCTEKIIATLNSLPLKELNIDIKNVEYLKTSFISHIKNKVYLEVDNNFLNNYFTIFLNKNKSKHNFETKAILLYNCIIESACAKNKTTVTKFDFPLL